LKGVLLKPPIKGIVPESWLVAMALKSQVQEPIMYDGSGALIHPYKRIKV